MLLSLIYILLPFFNLKFFVLELCVLSSGLNVTGQTLSFDNYKTNQHINYITSAKSLSPISDIDIEDITEERQRSVTSGLTSMPAQKLTNPALIQYLTKAESYIGKKTCALTFKSGVLLWLFAVH